MKHTTFFVLIDVLGKGIANCPQCLGFNRLEYDIEPRFIYCLDCDTQPHRLSDGNTKKFVFRTHDWLHSTFAGLESKKKRFISRVVWQDIWSDV